VRLDDESDPAKAPQNVNRLLEREQARFDARSAPAEQARDIVRSLAWQSWTEGKTIGLGIDKLARTILERASRDVGTALDAVPYVADGVLLRRFDARLEFVHRAVQEFLVAEHVMNYMTSSSFDEDEFVAIVPLITREITSFIASSHRREVLQHMRSIISMDPSRFPREFVNSFV
jgi:hypothetical protein